MLKDTNLFNSIVLLIVDSLHQYDLSPVCLQKPIVHSVRPSIRFIFFLNEPCFHCVPNFSEQREELYKLEMGVRFLGYFWAGIWSVRAG